MQWTRLWSWDRDSLIYPVKYWEKLSYFGSVEEPCYQNTRQYDFADLIEIRAVKTSAGVSPQRLDALWIQIKALARVAWEGSVWQITPFLWPATPLYFFGVCPARHAMLSPEEPSVAPRCWWDEIQASFSALLSLVSFSIWPLPWAHILEPASKICHFLSYTFNFPLSRHFYVSWLQKALVTICKYHCSHPALTIPSQDPPTPWQSPRLLSSELLIHASVLPGAWVPRCYLLKQRLWHYPHCIHVKDFMNHPLFCFMSQFAKLHFTAIVGTFISSWLWHVGLVAGWGDRLLRRWGVVWLQIRSLTLDFPAHGAVLCYHRIRHSSGEPCFLPREFAGVWEGRSYTRGDASFCSLAWVIPGTWENWLEYSGNQIRGWSRESI